MFRRLFIEAINGLQPEADANKDGYLTANELGLFLKQKVTDLSRNKQTPDYGPLREEGFDRGDFVFTIPSQATSPNVVPAGPQASVDEQVWIFARDMRDPKAIDQFLEKYPNSPFKSVALAQKVALLNPAAVETAPSKRPIDVVASPVLETSTIQSDLPDKVRAVSVLYGTDRNQNGGRFGSDRAGRLSTGRASVSIPADHKVGVIETASSISLLGLPVYQQEINTNRHFSVLSLESLAGDDLAQLLRPNAAEGAFIYVHGFNTPFEHALFRTAQLAWDLQFRGRAIAYSWPSQQSVSNYMRDRESAQQSSTYLREFISLVGKQNPVNIIAHAQGAIPVIEALVSMATFPFATRPVGEVILAAPDIDADSFERSCEQIKKIAQRITVYVSASDKALLVAAQLSGTPRAGAMTAQGPAIGSCAEVIDVSEVTDGILGLNHTVFAKDRSVLSDIALLLNGRSVPVADRPTLHQINGPKGRYWKYVK
jgi:esterase/lipase superfamily enzyme